MPARKNENYLGSSKENAAGHVSNEFGHASRCPLSSVFCRSTNLNSCGESVSTLTRCSPLNPQPQQPLQKPLQPLPPQVIPATGIATATATANATSTTATSEQVSEEASSNRDRDHHAHHAHHALHLDNRDYESVFIIERRNSKPNLR